MKTRTLMGRRPRPSSYAQKILSSRPVQPDGETAEHTFQALLIAELLAPPPQADLVELSRVILDDLGGSLIRTFGGAVIATFKRPSAATRAGVALQRQLQSGHLQLRVGVDFGPVARLGEEVFGESIIRLMELVSLARGGQLLISESVYQRLESDFPQPCMLFDAVIGDDAFEIFEVVWREGGVEAPERQRFKPGARLGDRYEILALLGEGGMGEVYQARDLALDERVALKFVRPDLISHPESIACFKDEVKLARALTHPNICRIHEFLEMEGHVFLSMEWVRGRTLAEILEQDSPLDGARAEWIALGISQGLAEAHRKGVIHRDLKPSNIMIEAETQRVVLMDFGIAQLTAQARASDQLVGTPEYMSPEQLQGKALTPASDIYALGVLLYEMVAGRPPYTGETPLKIGVKHLTEPPRPIDPPRPVSGALLAAVTRALKKDPLERFADAGALAVFLGGEEATAPRSPQGRGARLLLLAALLGGLSAGLIALWPRLSGHARVDLDAPRQSRLLISSLPVEEFARWSPDGEALAFIRGGDLWQMRLNGAPERVTHGARLLRGEGQRGLAWIDATRWIFAQGHEVEAGGVALSELSLEGGEAEVLRPGGVAVDISPDKETLVFSTRSPHQTWSLSLAPRAGGPARTLLPGGPSRGYTAPRFSPDGQRVALVIHQAGYRSTSDIGVFDLKTQRLRFLTEDGLKQRAFNTDPTWTPDGEAIIYASKRSGAMTLWWVSAQGGASHPLTRGATMDQRLPDVSPDGQRILFNTLQDEVDIELLNVKSGQIEPITRDIWPDRFPVFSADGQYIAFRAERRGQGQSRLLVLYDRLAGEERVIQAPRGLRDFDGCAAGQIVFAATHEGRRRLGLLDLKTTQTRTLLKGLHRIWSPSCAPDQRAVVFVAQEVEGGPRHLWLIDLKAERAAPKQLTQGEGFRNYPVWSPDGRQIAYRWAPSAARLGEAELRLLDAQTGVTRALPTPASWRRARRRLRFSADGQGIYYMEAYGHQARLWRVALSGGGALIKALKALHTFDYDLSPDGAWLVYPRLRRHGDLFVLEPPAP
ncbi:protein kinase [Myxococcota bacterium]|nr:protein kinase [Myxococcota bacterium]